MARINLEEALFKDNRFSDLVLKLGSKNAAIGALVSAWIVAQKFWVHSDHGIPKPEWIKQRLEQALIDTGLAYDRGDFVYMAGSQEQFDWLRRAAASGRKGGLKTQEILRSDPQATLKGSQASLLFSPSSSLSSPSSSSSLITPDSNTKKKPCASVNEPREKGVTNPVWLAYAAAYEKRHGTAPVRNKTINAQLAAFVRRIGKEEAPKVAEYYVSHPDQFYERTGHPTGIMLKDAEKLRMEWATGTRITGTMARNTEKAAFAQDQLERIARNEL